MKDEQIKGFFFKGEEEECGPSFASSRINDLNDMCFMNEDEITIL